MQLLAGLFWWFLTAKSKKSAKKSNRNPNTKGVKWAKFASVIQQAVVDMPPLSGTFEFKMMNRVNYSFGGALFFRRKNNFRKASSIFFISHRCNLFAIHIYIKEASHRHLLNSEVLKNPNTPNKN